MLSLLSSLMSNKKEGKSVAAYMDRVKSLVDDLSLIGHPLNDAQITAHTLNGLKDEFKELTAAVRVRDIPISFEDLYDKLNDEELTQNHGESKEEDTRVITTSTISANPINLATINIIKIGNSHRMVEVLVSRIPILPHILGI
ncbi:hypothetical protein Ddye_001275 [Dipteronia dyeriana]|uniref:Uncharacterized protein n=1 Tax=Dipteronia dyeriana TaxID=168575 RepID=A0AAD9XN49_9ROSI|nr:hypothetical protein Ddye_001275 [Dipteronia dyeriana]